MKNFSLIIISHSKETNKIYSWGWNYKGQLGFNDNKNRNIPTNIEILNNKNIISIFSGNHHNFCISGNFYLISLFNF